MTYICVVEMVVLHLLDFSCIQTMKVMKIIQLCASKIARTLQNNSDGGDALIVCHGYTFALQDVAHDPSVSILYNHLHTVLLKIRVDLSCL